MDYRELTKYNISVRALFVCYTVWYINHKFLKVSTFIDLYPLLKTNNEKENPFLPIKILTLIMISFMPLCRERMH